MQRSVPVGRIVGIDLARCLALLGMFVAHLSHGTDGPGGVGTAYQIVSGRSAALFAVLAGVSIALMTRSQPGRTTAGHRRALATRAVLIALIGLPLGLLNSGLAVILTFYGVLFLLGIPVLTWSARPLGLLALGWGLVSPVVSLLVRPHLPAPTFVVPSLTDLTDPLGLLIELTVTGYYPVLTWGTYLFAGMAIGRLDLRSGQVRRHLFVIGAWLAVLSLALARLATRSEAVRAALVGSYDRFGRVETWADLDHALRLGLYGTTPTGSWSWLWVWSPHSGSIVDLAHTVGSSMAVLGLCLFLANAAGRYQGWVRVASGAGTMTLTLYTLHVVIVAVGHTNPFSPVASWALNVWVHVAGALLIGAVFALTRTRGPLEQLVSELSAAARGPGEGR